MKYLLILSCLLFTSVGWSKDVSYDDLVKREGLYYEKFTREPFTGNVTGGKQGKIIKGRPDGEFVEYFENGQLKRKGNFKDDKQEGEYLSYYENGQLKIKCNLKDGKEEGEYLEYYESGELLYKRYYKQGKKDGLSITYYSNGKLNEQKVYKDGELIETITP